MNKETKMWKALLLPGLISVPLSASAQSVKGQVKDATTGEPLIGVTIRSLGSKKMAITPLRRQARSVCVSLMSDTTIPTLLLTDAKLSTSG